MSELMALSMNDLYAIGLVFAVISIPVNIIGMCKYGWYDRNPGILAAGLALSFIVCVQWFMAIPFALACLLLYAICKGIVALCPNE